MLLSLVILSYSVLADEQTDEAIEGIRNGPVERMKEYADQLKSDRDQLIEILIEVITDERALTLAAADSLGSYDKPVVYKHLPLKTRSYRERISAACDILGDLKAEEAVRALLPLVRLGRWEKMPDRTKVLEKDYPAFGALIKIGRPALEPAVQSIRSCAFMNSSLCLLSQITGSAEQVVKMLERELAQTAEDTARQNLRNAIEYLRTSIEVRHNHPPVVVDRATIPTGEVVIQKDVPYLSKEEAMSNVSAVIDCLKKYTRESKASWRKEHKPEDKQSTQGSKKPIHPPDEAATGNEDANDGTYEFLPLLIPVVIIVAGAMVFLLTRRRGRRA
jgi:hypothetical protein